jgi:arabinose-5-phosphate isomerase
MRTGEAIPRVSDNASLSEAVLEMSKRGMGMTAIVDHSDRLVGIFTDGDLRRTLDKLGYLRKQKVSGVMTPRPRTIRPNQLAVEAVQLMEEYKITQLLAVDTDMRLVGALNMHDLMRAKVI